MRYSLIRWSLAALLVLLTLPILGYAFFKDTPLFSPEPSGEAAVSPSRNEKAPRDQRGIERAEAPVNRASRDRTRRDEPRREKAPDADETDSRLPAPQKSCDDSRVMVDKEHGLPPDYEPRDLISLDEYGVPNKGDSLLRREAAEHLQEMVFEARAAGVELMVDSAYRSYAQQKWTFANYSFVHGSQRANVTSARPGHSQHQLGTTVDFTNAAVGYQLLPVFGRTAAGLWLDEHALDHGFAMPYTDEAEPDTGVQAEPWHYRYIGVKNAKRLQKSDLSVQSFLERESVLPRC